MLPDEEDIPADLSALIRLGKIIEVGLPSARCRVRFGDAAADDEEGETPPIRWLNGRAGKTRKWSAPSEGEEVVLLCPDGQIGNAVALCGLTNGSAPAPSDQDIELIEFEDGAVISYDAIAHELRAILPDGATALVEAPGGLRIKGDVSIEGTVTIDGHVSIDGAVDATGDVTGDGISLKSHIHGMVQAGSAKSGAPE